MQDLTTQQKRPVMTYTQKSIGSPPLINPSLVSELFREIASICPAWKLAFEKGEMQRAMKNWKLALEENGISEAAQIGMGLKAMRAKGNAFMPSTGDFIQMCKTGMAESMGIKSFKDTMRIIERSNSNHPQNWHLWVELTPFEYWIKCEQRIAERDGFEGTFLSREMKEIYNEGIDKVFNGFEFPCAPTLIKPNPIEPGRERTAEEIKKSKEIMDNLKGLF